MKKYFIILIFHIFSLSIAQDYKIPPIQFEGKSEVSSYVDFLKLSDINSLIINFGYTWSQNGILSKFVVFQSDGKVLKYNVYFKMPTEKPIIKKKVISKRNSKHYWKFLGDSFNNNKFKIDKSRLNINEKPIEDGTVSSMTFSHGSYCFFNIYQNENFLTYSSYQPESFIENKFPGYEERAKLVQLVSEFEILYEKY